MFSTLKTILKYTLLTYTLVSVAFFTATIDGSQHKLKFWTDNAKAMQEITKEPGEMNYQQWRKARAKHMMETDSWKDHMLQEAKDAVDKHAHTESRTKLEKKKEAFNMKVYGQKTVPSQKEWEQRQNQ